MQSKLLVKAENILVKFGDRTVLDFERFMVYQGERIGLVGINGAGKTTLLKVLSGERKPDGGRVDLDCSIHFFKQFSEGYDPCELDQKEVKTMKVQDKIWQADVSGGEDTRIRLAQMFGSAKMLLLLDEPTSNLDMAGIEMLKKRLSVLESMVIVSHDRALLNALCTRIVEVKDGGLTSYDGNYDAYAQINRQAVLRQWTEYENYVSEKKRLEKVYMQKKEKAKSIEKLSKGMSPREARLRNFISKHPKDTKARKMESQAKNVLERLEHLEVKEKPKETPRMRPDFRMTDPPENAIVIRAENLCFSYPDGRTIFEDASFLIRNKSKVAVVGANGAGKSTLLKLIWQAAGGREDGGIGALRHGRIQVVPKAFIGFLEQNMALLDYEKTVLQNVMEVSVQKEEIARAVLARLLFSARDIKKKAGVLSGGERVKLAFAKLFVDKVNLLMLDEPTNYLDIPSEEALEEMFSEYEGTLIFASHDEAFIRACATDILVVEDGKIINFLGTPEEYFRF